MKIFLPAMMLTMLVGLVISGCSQTLILYVPPPAHLPLLTNAGEVDLAVLGSFDGFDARAAWSPVKHLEIFGLGSYHDATGDSAGHLFRAYGELGAGWYTRLGTMSTLSGFAGYGWGRSKAARERREWGRLPQMDKASATYERPFIGIGIGFSGRIDTSRLAHVDYGATLRIARVDFTTLEERSRSKSGSAWFVEPVFVGRLGIRAVQIEYQTGFNASFYGSGIESTDLTISVGMHIQLDQLF